MSVTTCAVFLALFVIPLDGLLITSADDFRKARTEIIGLEMCMRLGAGIILNEKERILNGFLMHEKQRTIEDSRLNGKEYMPATSFYRSKPWMESTPIFKIIKAMPKGAALHLHDHAITSLDWVIKNITYRDNVYMCIDSDKFIRLTYHKNEPPEDCDWKLVTKMRNAAPNASDFDLMLKRNLSLLGTDPLVTYPTTTQVWTRFEKYFRQITHPLYYAPFMKDYLIQALEEFRKDNVQYVELRGKLKGYYYSADDVRDAEFGLNLIKEVSEKYVHDHPDFSGVKVIMTGKRYKSQADVMEGIKTAMQLRAKYPNFFLGYDIVAHEDPNHPLLYYIEELLYPSKQRPPVQLPYFFHAAETNWQGTDVDYNLVDALLLNTTRIGHGYGLIKHPRLAHIIKTQKIAIEVTPISNQLLGLVKDLRNHAMAPLISQNTPLVISSDDPSTWEALPLSHDMYVAFMTMTGKDGDLTILKQLAINSIQYSGMSSAEKGTAMRLWQTKWDKFVNDTITIWKLLAADLHIVAREVSCNDLTMGSSTASGENVQHVQQDIPNCLMLSIIFVFLLQ